MIDPPTTGSAAPGLGRVTISPDRGQAGHWGTWTVRFTTGEAGIQQGGAIQVALPRRWVQPDHVFYPEAWYLVASRRVQATEPQEAHHVTARTSRADARVACEVEGQTPFGGVDVDRMGSGDHPELGTGRPSRFAWTIRVTLTEGSLAPGDTIDVVFGDRSAGSPGWAAPLWTGSPERVRAAIDPAGAGQFTLLPDEALPWLYGDPGEPVELTVIIPSTTVAGEPAEALVIALDANQNPVWAPGLRAELIDNRQSGMDDAKTHAIFASDTQGDLIMMNWDMVPGWLDMFRAIAPEFTKALDSEISIEQAAINMRIAGDAALAQAAR